MHLTFRNVNYAFRGIVELFAGKQPDLEAMCKKLWPGITIFPAQLAHIRAQYDQPRQNIRKTSSRNGDVLVIDEPVTITYTSPKERVLFNQARDCNPFFHLYESLWMLAGRNDVAPLAYYNSQIANYSDDGKTFNGAYGYRWRHATDWQAGPDACPIGWREIDQLQLLIAHLKAQLDSRRGVLQMWNVEDDLLKIGQITELRDSNNPSYRGQMISHKSKDVTCNLSVMFLLRGIAKEDSQGQVIEGSNYFLDMTVINRSNDAIWGMLGANVVHMSFLQEYMAANLGVEVGNYHQVTNNLHVYLDKFSPESWLDDKIPDHYWGPSAQLVRRSSVIPLIKDPAVFEKELPLFVERHSKNAMGGRYLEPFLEKVAQPMCLAFHHHKQRDYDTALRVASQIRADDWRIVCHAWLDKRRVMWQQREMQKTNYTQGVE